MSTLRIGSPLDKAIDIGAIIARVQLERIDSLVKQGIAEGATCWQPETVLPSRGLFYKPTLLSNVHPTSIVAQQEILWPGAGRDDLSHPAGSSGTGEQYGLWIGGECVERKREPGAAGRRANKSWRGLGEQHQSVRRGVRIWRVSRKRIRPRRRQGRTPRIPATCVVQKRACAGGRCGGPEWRSGSCQSFERDRSHRKTLYRWKTNQAGFRIQRRRVRKQKRIVG